MFVLTNLKPLLHRNFNLFYFLLPLLRRVVELLVVVFEGEEELVVLVEVLELVPKPPELTVLLASLVVKEDEEVVGELTVLELVLLTVLAVIPLELVLLVVLETPEVEVPLVLELVLLTVVAVIPPELVVLLVVLETPEVEVCPVRFVFFPKLFLEVVVVICVL